MNKICLLDKSYNKCPYIAEDQTCQKNAQCNMQIKLQNNASGYSYVREPRWYEKYYKKKTFL